MTTKRTIKPIHPDWRVVGHNAYHGCDIHERVVRGIGRYVMTVSPGHRSLLFFRSGNRGKSPDRYWKKDESSVQTAQNHERYMRGVVGKKKPSVGPKKPAARKPARAGTRTRASSRAKSR